MLQGGADELIRAVWVSFPLCGSLNYVMQKFHFAIFYWSVKLSS
jgi:hypothetical protein